MPEGSWERLLPSAWTPQANPNAQVEAGNAASANIASMARTGSDIETARQDRVRKQALQDIMAQSIETVIGPDGKPTHHFSNDKFLSLLPTNKAAADAYALWNEKINPANATMATQRGMAQSTTPEGGLDAGALAKAAQGSEYAGQILAAGRGIQQAQASTSTDVASNRFAQDKLVEGTTAPQGSLLYNEQVKPKSVVSAGTGSGAITAEDVSKLTAAGREAALYNLRAKGRVLPANASAADIADAANSLADAEVSRQTAAGADLQKPISLATSAFQAAASAPSTRNKVYGDIFGNSMDYTGKKISNAAAGMNLEGAQAGKAKTEDVAATLKIPRDRIGNSTTQVTQDKIDNANLTVKSYAKLTELTNEIQAKIKSGVIDPNTPEGNKRLLAETTAMLGQIQNIYGGAGTEGSVTRAMRDIGAPDDVVEAAVQGGLHKGLATWFGNKQVNTASLLAGAPDRAKASAVLALQDVYSADPEGVLAASIKPKRLAPSAFAKPGSSATSKADPLGIRK